MNLTHLQGVDLVVVGRLLLQQQVMQLTSTYGLSNYIFASCKNFL